MNLPGGVQCFQVIGTPLVRFAVVAAQHQSNMFQIKQHSWFRAHVIGVHEHRSLAEKLAMLFEDEIKHRIEQRMSVRFAFHAKVFLVKGDTLKYEHFGVVLKGFLDLTPALARGAAMNNDDGTLVAQPVSTPTAGPGIPGIRLSGIRLDVRTVS